MARRDAPDDPTCTICGRSYGSHTGKKCDACGAPIEHHKPPLVPKAGVVYVDEAECWRNRAHAAWCKAQAGLELNNIERKALRKYPDPEMLTASGYVPLSEITESHAIERTPEATATAGAARWRSTLKERYP